MRPCPLPLRVLGRLGLAVLCALVAERSAAPGWARAWAEDAPAPEDSTAQALPFFTSVRAAREAAALTQRPLFVALHWRVAPGHPWPSDPQGWIALYRDPRVRAAALDYVCALRILEPPPGPTLPPPLLLVLAPDGTVLLQEAAWAFERGEASAVALAAFLQKGLRTHGPTPLDSPRVGEEQVRKARPQPAGGSPLAAVPLPIQGEGLAVRLRWEFPVPLLPEGQRQELEGRLSFTFDGEGPWDLSQVVKGRSGEELEQWVEIRFADVPGLEALRTQGEHLLELWLKPTATSYPFADGPVRVASVWISLGDGGGGASNGSESAEAPAPPEPAPLPEPPPAQAPDGPDPQEAPPEPPRERTEVVEPFVREGEEVRKQDAIVAVPDPDAGVKPPERMPVRDALRDLERRLEQAVREERVAPADRDFLRRYFESLKRRVSGAER